MTKEELVDIALEARELAYVPYSHFRVGAALLTKDGRVFKGANMENAAYGCSMCGERNALYHAYMEGIRKEDIEALAIVSDAKRPVSPCGQCRQVLSELYPSDKPIYLSNENKKILTYTIEDLLPYSFEKEDLL